MKKSTFLFCFLLIALTTLVVLSIFSDPSHHSDAPSLTTAEQNPLAKGHFSHPQNNKVTPHEQPNTQTVEEQPSDNFEGDLWRVSEEAKEILQQSVELPKDLRGEHYLELDVETIEKLDMGDTFELVLPHIGTSFTAEVDKMVTHSEGIRTIEANFPGMDKRNFSVITLVPGGLYVEISTPAGAFTMQGTGRYAWIAARGDIPTPHHH